MRLGSHISQWPRLKKMYLILILTAVCIFIFQFHISKAQLEGQNVVQEDIAPIIEQIVHRHQEPMRELLLADSVAQAVTVRDENRSGDKLSPPLYIITPTFRRGEQLAELTRLGYTLKHLARVFWLVIEDAATPTPAVTKLLTRIGVPFTHLVGE